MWAILSDIHGNLEALTAVLADIDRHAVERVFCLGDLVGYGPDPRACIDLVRERCEVVLAGYFDQAALFESEEFFAPLERTMPWTRQQLHTPAELPGVREGRFAFLAELPRAHRIGAQLFVHGTAHDPVDEYVFPEDIYNPHKMERIFDLIDWVCFCGHTHVPGVFLDEDRRFDLKLGMTRRAGREPLWHYLAPEECDYTCHLDDRKAIVNVGSVGQPRDGDPRACYVLLDRYTVRWRRVDYDLETTIRKIHAIPAIHNMHGDRLRDGR